MTSQVKIYGVLFLLFITSSVFAQSKKEQALEKGMAAIQLMDNGKIDESIKLLEEAQKLDPKRFDYPYEMAYAYYLKQDYNKAITILEKNKKHPDVTERLFQLLGNAYDLSGNSEKAFKAYDEGLVKFPNSGMIYLEKGNVYWGKKEYGKALPFYEKGIQVDPMFPSNYYRAALLYCSTTEEVWGLIYGEIFMNLERNTDRTAEISKLIFDTYKSEIKFTSDSTATVSFCQQMTISMDALKDPGKFKMPFCMTFEPAILLAVAFEKQIDINSLDRIRGRFIDNYFANENNKKYPNVLFDYQKKIEDAGHFEAYNHWILMKGDEDMFLKWQEENQKKWDAFVEWFMKNALELDANHKFYSGQYDN